ncbi:MAG: hypothetical protein AB7U73_21915 [Pirellulales bacterium]
MPAPDQYWPRSGGRRSGDVASRTPPGNAEPPSREPRDRNVSARNRRDGDSWRRLEQFDRDLADALEDAQFEFDATWPEGYERRGPEWDGDLADE